MSSPIRHTDISGTNRKEIDFAKKKKEEETNNTKN